MLRHGFAVPCLAKKSLRFFSVADCRTVVMEKIACSLQRAMIGSFFIFGYDSFEPHKEIVDCFYKFRKR